ncbi:urease-associated protein [Agrobacterium tumefaciens CCNWGS0286]|uniref:lysozyme inhibitor LprI family protein n=1 Tax=Agrobacterium tumefaciens TaxID=358 RepID=UPI00023346A9|nr:lysozyme inhibitor LprI family protein [Agrobacterium tumefaciens]EHH02584.1 urease-associated protein [Agrobacterium tumefaciens CCNWGS0286]
MVHHESFATVRSTGSRDVNLADESCGNKTNQTEMNVCASESLKKSDAEMNKVYKEIEGRLKGDADTTKLLVATQRAWIAFRDAECDFQTSNVRTGTVYPFVNSSCHEGLTQSRTEDLKGYLQCTEGDLDCPVPAAN